MIALWFAELVEEIIIGGRVHPIRNCPGDSTYGGDMSTGCTEALWVVRIDWEDVAG
jgi:hypothetical protein